MTTMPLPRSLRSVTAAVVALALVPGVVACTPDDDSAEGPSGCSASVEAAAEAIEPDQQVVLLDDALVACASYATFRSEVGEYPGIIGYDFDTYLRLRCERTDDERLRNTPACDVAVGPPTTPPEVTVPDLVFVGETLDGRQIEITPSDLVEFDGDVPAVVQQTVDIAVESGCEGVIEHRDRWASRADDPEIGDFASVYAQHAQNVAIYIRCDTPPIPGVDTGEEEDD